MKSACLERLVRLTSVCVGHRNGAIVSKPDSVAKVSEPQHEKTNVLHTRKQRCRVKLISAFVFATWIVQYPFFLNTKFPASSHVQWLHSLVCIRPGQNPHCWFSHTGAQVIWTLSLKSWFPHMSSAMRKPVYCICKDKTNMQTSPCNAASWSAAFLLLLRYDPWRKKTSLRDSWPGLTQTGLCNHRRELDAWNFKFRR